MAESGESLGTLRATQVGVAQTELSEQAVEGALIFALLWGFGGVLRQAEREAMSRVFRLMHAGQWQALKEADLLGPETESLLLQSPRGLEEFGSGISSTASASAASVRLFGQHLPPTGSCFEYAWQRESFKWSRWEALVEPPAVWRAASPDELQSLVISTPQLQRLEAFAHLTTSRTKRTSSLLVVGESGTGKSKCLLDVLQRQALEALEASRRRKAFTKREPRNAPSSARTLRQSSATAEDEASAVEESLVSSKSNSANSDGHRLLALSLTGATSPALVQSWLETNLEKKGGGTVLSPQGFSRGVFFLDDLHLPPTEATGAQPTGEFLRQLLDRGGFLQSEGGWKFTRCSSLALAATTRLQQKLSLRLLRHFVPLALEPLETASLSAVLEQLLVRRFWNAQDESSVGALQKVAVLTEALFRRVLKLLPPRPARWTQQWSTRDACKVVEGIAQLRTFQLAEPQLLLRCWLHEARRVFCDRITLQAEADLVEEALAAVLNEKASGVALKDLQTNAAGALASQFSWVPAPETAEDKLKEAGDGGFLGGRVYRQLSVAEAMALCREAIEQQALLHAKTSQAALSLVLFPQAVEHALRCARAFSLPQGHALLLGVGGSGRNSSAKLGALLTGLEVSAAATDGGGGGAPSVGDWKEALKGLLLNLAAFRKPQVLFINGAHLAQDSIAADVCTLILMREIPDVLSEDDKVRRHDCSITVPSLSRQTPQKAVSPESEGFSGGSAGGSAESRGPRRRRRRFDLCLCVCFWGGFLFQAERVFQGRRRREGGDALGRRRLGPGGLGGAVQKSFAHLRVAQSERPSDPVAAQAVSAFGVSNFRGLLRPLEEGGLDFSGQTDSPQRAFDQRCVGS